MPIQYNNTRIFAATVVNDGAEHFDPVHAHACAFHIMDIILEEDISENIVIVADCQHISLAHAMKVDFIIQRNLKIVMEVQLITFDVDILENFQSVHIIFFYYFLKFIIIRESILEEWELYIWSI